MTATPGLYASGYRPKGTRRAWEASSMGLAGTGDVLRRAGILRLWGDPIDAVAFFTPTTGALRVLVADYANGVRVTHRQPAYGPCTLTIERKAA